LSGFISQKEKRIGRQIALEHGKIEGVDNMPLEQCKKCLCMKNIKKGSVCARCKRGDEERCP